MIRLKNILLEQYIDPSIMPLPSDRTGKGGDFERQTRAMGGSEKKTYKSSLPVIENVDKVISKIDKALKKAKTTWRNKINDPETAKRWQRSHGASAAKWKEVKQLYLFYIHKSFTNPKTNWVIPKKYEKYVGEYKHPTKTEYYSLSLIPDDVGIKNPWAYVFPKAPKYGIFLVFNVFPESNGNITIEPKPLFTEDLVKTFTHEIQHFLFAIHPLTSIKQIRKITRPKAKSGETFPITDGLKQYAKQIKKMGWDKFQNFSAKRGLNKFQQKFFDRVVRDVKSYYEFAGEALDEGTENHDWCVYMICQWIAKEDINCKYALNDSEMLSRVSTIRQRIGTLEIPKEYLINAFENQYYKDWVSYNWIFDAWVCNGFAPSLIDVYNETQNFVYNDAGSDELGDKTQTMA
jgi:hypothetical protein